MTRSTMIVVLTFVLSFLGVGQANAEFGWYNTTLYSAPWVPAASAFAACSAQRAAVYPSATVLIKAYAGFSGGTPWTMVCLWGAPGDPAPSDYTWGQTKCPAGQRSDIYAPNGCVAVEQVKPTTCDRHPINVVNNPVNVVGNPINVIDGSKVAVVTEFTTSGPHPLALTRFYNSRNGQGSRIGTGWRTQYDNTLVADGSTPTYVHIRRADGTEAVFQKWGSVWKPAYWNTSISSYQWPTTTATWTLVQNTSNWQFTDEDGTLETYDSSGNLLSIQKLDGYQITLAYNTAGLNTTVTDSLGRQITFTYYTNGRLQTATDPDGQVYRYTYVYKDPAPQDPNQIGGNWVLDKVYVPDNTPSDPNDNPFMQYQYEDTNYPHFLTGVTDERGVRYATWTYDTQGRATLSKHAGDVDETTLSYDDVNLTRTATNPLGKQAIYSLASFQGSLRTTQVAGQVSTHCAAANTSFTYDTNGFVATKTDGEGRVTQYTNSSRGLPTQIVEAYGTSSARTTSITWDATYPIPTQMVLPGRTLDLTYDATSHLLTQYKETDTTTQSVPYSTNGQTRIWAYTYTTGGELDTVDGPLAGTGDTVNYDYDAHGFVNQVTDQLGHVTQITSVNGRGQPLTIVDPNSVQTALTYDNRGRLLTVTANPGSNQAVTTFTYDQIGQIATMTSPAGTTFTFAYDDARRLSSITNGDSEQIAYTHDVMGDVTGVTVKNASAATTKSLTRTFDELGRLLQSIGASSQTTTFSYDKVDNLTGITDPRSKVYGRTFDALNRVITETDPDLYHTNTAYNGTDTVTSVTDARSLATSYVRDGFGDAIRRTSPDTGTTDFWYDAAGNVTKKVDARSVETDYTYDNASRVLTTTYPAASAENETYTYDATTGGNKGIGRLTSLADASGSASYTYDALGHITTVVQVISGTPYTTGYTYDAAGRVLTMTYPSGRIVTYSRDSQGRVSGITTKANAGATQVTVFSGATYMPFGPLAGGTFGNGIVLSLGYDQDYRLTTLNATDGTTAIQSLTYGYDAASNITSIADGVTSARNQTLTYDDLNRLATASGVYGSQSYAYDGVGNRTSRVAAGGTDTYAYQSTANRINTITTGSSVRTIVHANSGQIIQDGTSGAVMTYALYNSGRISSAALNSSTVGSYAYDASGRRVQTVAGVNTTQFIYDLSGRLMAEANGSGTAQVEYIWLDALPVAQVAVATSTLYFVHTDHLGHPQKMTDASKSVVFDVAVDPFGNYAAGSYTVFNPLQFPGQYADSTAGLFQNWFREYDPTTGRYIQSDPIGLAGGINTYAYVSGNPVTAFDPWGLIPVESLAAILYNETQSLSGPGLDQARENVAHAIINGDTALGDKRPKTAPDTLPKGFDQGIYKACSAAAKQADENQDKGIDPTHGAMNFNMRNSNSTKPFYGLPISTQSGPFNNSYTAGGLNASGVYVNTYGGRP